MMQKYPFHNKKIIVVGTIFLDIKGYPDPPFFPAGRNAGRIEYQYGGVARNVAGDLAGLGFHPVFVSLTDQGGPGQMIVEDLRSSGVNVEFVIPSKEGIGTWMVILDTNGEVCANLSKRQSLMPLCGLLDRKGREMFRDSDGIMLEMDADEEVVKRVFQLARMYQSPVYGVISNMTIARERISYIRQTACFVCNKLEAGLLFNRDTRELNPAEMLTLLKEQRNKMQIPNMIVTMDRDGSVFADSAGQEGYCPACKTEIMDSTGAGDAFFAGAAAGLMEGCSLEQAARIGTEMAAAVISSEENVYREKQEGLPG